MRKMHAGSLEALRVTRPEAVDLGRINRKIVNTALGRDVADALAEYPVPVLKTTICQRVALAESAAQGLTVLETAPEGPAAREITALVDEILEHEARQESAT